MSHVKEVHSFKTTVFDRLHTTKHEHSADSAPNDGKNYQLIAIDCSKILKKLQLTQ